MLLPYGRSIPARRSNPVFLAAIRPDRNRANFVETTGATLFPSRPIQPRDQVRNNLLFGSMIIGDVPKLSRDQHVADVVRDEIYAVRAAKDESSPAVS
jgi:hypothetical protein